MYEIVCINFSINVYEPIAFLLFLYWLVTKMDLSESVPSLNCPEKIVFY